MKNLSILLLVMLSVSLSGCYRAPEPKIYGVPQSQWQNLVPSQKRAVIRQYNKCATVTLAHPDHPNDSSFCMGSKMQAKTRYYANAGCNQKPCNQQ